MNAASAFQSQLRGRLLQDAPMARYSTWRAGGKADTLFIPVDQQDLVDFMAGLDTSVPVHCIGLGSNLLIRDGGVRGVVVRMAPGLAALSSLGDGKVVAGAGVAAPKLARYAAKTGLGGAEFMSGIPGSVGGALAMNAGCFGSCTWDIVAKVSVMAENRQLLELPADEFNIGYRSVKHPDFNKLCFLAGEFSLSGLVPNNVEQTKEILRQREQTQPVGTANAGSVFVNPPGDAAGRLIEEAGLAEYCIGDAVVSSKHCNFIINRGNAKASDIEALIEHVRAVVRECHGVDLQTEVRIIGEAT